VNGTLITRRTVPQGGGGGGFYEMSSVADPDPGSGAFLTPGSGSGMNNPGHISESL
jgi:hypothetical protein